MHKANITSPAWVRPRNIRMPPIRSCSAAARLDDGGAELTTTKIEDRLARKPMRRSLVAPMPPSFSPPNDAGEPPAPVLHRLLLVSRRPKVISLQNSDRRPGASIDPCDTGPEGGGSSWPLTCSNGSLIRPSRPLAKQPLHVRSPQSDPPSSQTLRQFDRAPVTFFQNIRVIANQYPNGGGRHGLDVSDSTPSIDHGPAPLAGRPRCVAGGGFASRSRKEIENQHFWSTPPGFARSPRWLLHNRGLLPRASGRCNR